MERVEALDNYNIIAKLAYTLGFMIIAIGIISILIYVYTVMWQLLSQHRIFIGIFTAYGITDNTIIKMYINLMWPYILKNLVLALMLAAGIGYGLFSDSFNMVNFVLLGFVVAMWLSSWISARVSAKEFLDHSPGDLLYDRIGTERRTSPPVHIQKKNNHLMTLS